MSFIETNTYQKCKVSEVSGKHGECDKGQRKFRSLQFDTLSFCSHLLQFLIENHVGNCAKGAPEHGVENKTFRLFYLKYLLCVIRSMCH